MTKNCDNTMLLYIDIHQLEWWIYHFHQDFNMVKNMQCAFHIQNYQITVYVLVYLIPVKNTENKGKRYWKEQVMLLTESNKSIVQQQKKPMWGFLGQHRRIHSA